MEYLKKEMKKAVYAILNSEEKVYSNEEKEQIYIKCWDMYLTGDYKFKDDIEKNFECVENIDTLKSCTRTPVTYKEFKENKEKYTKYKKVIDFSKMEIENKILINFLQKILKLKLKNFTQNKNVIILKLIELLKSETEKPRFTIIKLDISKYYNSIDKKQVIKKIKQNPKIYEKQLHKILDEHINYDAFEGLLLGMPTSNIIAEYNGQKIDKIIKNIISKEANIYMYERYVDDIIILLEKNTNLYQEELISKINSKIEEYSKKHGAEIFSKLNEDKSKIIEDTADKEFDFLGYRFLFNGKWYLDVSKKKIEKTQAKIENLNNWLQQEIDKNKDKKILTLYFWDKYCYLTRDKLFFDHKNNKVIKVGIKENYKYLNLKLHNKSKNKSKKENIFDEDLYKNSNLKKMICTENIKSTFLKMETSKMLIKKDPCMLFDFKGYLKADKTTKINLIESKSNFKKLKQKVLMYHEYLEETIDLNSINYNQLLKLYINLMTK